MAEEFDIEAYLEAAVDGSAKGQQKVMIVILSL